MTKTPSLMMRVLLMLGLASAAPALAAQGDVTPVNAYAFSFHKLIGKEDLALADFKGQVILVVNTASQCGFTGQYEGLEKLYETYSAQGLVIIGVPSNDFGQQEPGSAEEISGFCKLNYGVSFPMASKEIVSGDNAHPFYQWARGVFGYIGAPKWNFHKYLINRRGELVDYFHSTTKPLDSSLTGAIEKELAEPQS